MAVGPMLLFAARLPYMDYSHPYQLTSYRMLIPTPELATNFGAPWKPFSFIVGQLALKVSRSSNFVANARYGHCCLLAH